MMKKEIEKDREGDEGDRVIDFAVSNDMIVSNTIFRKRQEHWITYKSRESQFDFTLCRVDFFFFYRKVIPGGYAAAQCRFVCLS